MSLKSESKCSNEKNIVVSQFESYDLPNVTVSQFLFEKISSNPCHQIAIIDARSGEEVFYYQLHQQAVTLSLGLVQSGLCKQDLVLFYAENSRQYVVSMLSLIYLGIVFSPVKPANGPFELVQQIRDSRGSVLLIDCFKFDVLNQALAEPLYRNSISNLKLIVMLNFSDEISSPKVELLSKLLNFEEILKIGSIYQEEFSRFRSPYFDSDIHDPLVIMYTSGTTGLPKGAIHTHQSILASLLNMRPEQENTTGFRYLFWWPLAHVSGLFFGLSIFSWNMIMVLESEVCNLNERVLPAVEKYQVNQLPITLGTAIELARISFEKKFDLHSLKVMSFAGNKIPQEIQSKLKEKYSIVMLELYGSTEMMGSVLQIGHNWTKGSVGVLCPNNRMKILDLYKKDTVPAMECGEICFQGPALFSGYLNNMQATNETIQNDWYHTGDVGYYDQSGSLFIVDRIKELIKFRHWSISPVEIEDFLLRQSTVEACCVVGVPHITDGYLLRAYIKLIDGSSPDSSELVKIIEKNLGFQKRLRAGIQLVDQIKRTLIGKIDRKHYRDLVENELLTEIVD